MRNDWGRRIGALVLMATGLAGGFAGQAQAFSGSATGTSQAVGNGCTVDIAMGAPIRLHTFG